MRSHRHLDQVGPLISFRAPSVLLAAALLVCSGSAQNEDPLAARSKGAAGAPVTVYEMADFQCPACRMFAVTVLPTIEQEYVQTGKVRWVFINLPLTSIHPNAVAAAEVAMCAARQGRFWPTHDALYQQPLGNRGRTADMVDKLPLQVADKATLGAPTIDTIANGPALKFPRMRTNPPPTRH